MIKDCFEKFSLITKRALILSLLKIHILLVCFGNETKTNHPFYVFETRLMFSWHKHEIYDVKIKPRDCEDRCFRYLLSNQKIVRARLSPVFLLIFCTFFARCCCFFFFKKNLCGLFCFPKFGGCDTQDIYRHDCRLVPSRSLEGFDENA